MKSHNEDGTIFAHYKQAGLSYPGDPNLLTRSCGGVTMTDIDLFVVVDKDIESYSEDHFF